MLSFSRERRHSCLVFLPCAYMSRFQGDNKLDIDCKNADGLTALLLVTRDAALFEKLGNLVGKQFRPVETVKELIAKGAYVYIKIRHDLFHIIVFQYH